MIITSALIDEIGGVELIKMLSIPAATKGIPKALLTSFGKDDQRFNDLPSDVEVIRKDSNFSKDLVSMFGQNRVGLGTAIAAKSRLFDYPAPVANGHR